MTDRSEMTAALEAVLFVSGEPVSRNRLTEMFGPEETEEAAAALAEIEERFCSPNGDGASSRGVILEEVAGGLRFITRPDLDEWLRLFFEASRGRGLSMGALETLAIVAYRQPVTAPEIQELRGVSPAGVLKTLLERRLVRISGRKEVVGKPFLYATTQDFLVHFGLKSLKDLPPLEEFEEALAGEGLGELLGGTDFEEEALREAAAVEEKLEEKAEKKEREEEEVEREEREQLEAEAGGSPPMGDPEGDEPPVGDDPPTEAPVPEPPPDEPRPPRREPPTEEPPMEEPPAEEPAAGMDESDAAGAVEPREGEEGG